MKNQKHINLVKWFGTNDGSKYGFIEYDNLINKENAVFLHKNNILQPSQDNLSEFFENQVVTFCVRHSKKGTDKLESYDVLLLEDENDNEFLISEFFLLFKAKNYNTLYKKLSKEIKNRKNTFFLYQNLIEINLIDILKEEDFDNNLKTLLEIFAEIITDSPNLTDIIIQQVLLEIETKPSLINSHLNYLSDIFDTDSNIQRKLSLGIIDLIESKKFSIISVSQLEKILRYLSTDLSDENINTLIEQCDFAILKALWLTKNQDNLTQNNYELILTLLIKHPDSPESLSNIVETKNFFKQICDRELGNYYNQVLNLTDNKTKVLLWLNDEIEYFDFDLYLTILPILDFCSQQLFIKKLFSLIAKQELKISAKQIIALPVNDYSTKVAFEFIKKISDKENINKNFLKYDLLRTISESNLINHASDILNLNGFFNLCQGRIIETTRAVNTTYYPNSINSISGQFIKDGNIIEDKQYFYIRKAVEKFSEQNPNPIACDGQLSTRNGAENLSKGGERFLWCRNRQCFGCSRVYQNDTNWQNYTILDFLKILNIEFSEYTIEILYGAINRVNRFLEHLNCKSCGKLLKPNGNSNYTYYRVSTFSCDNQDCLNPDKNVYISHCSNGHCNGTIDSRVSVKCNNGWVICSSCFACCSEEGLSKRNTDRQINYMRDVAWRPAHKGLAILCPKCANPMQYKDVSQKQEEYSQVLKDFERLANLNISAEQKLVGKFGTNSLGLKWFVVYQRHLTHKNFMNNLYYWKSLGFDITDFPTKLDKKNYLVSEPAKQQNLNRISNFHCLTCNHTYDYNNDTQLYNAVRYWHFL